MVRSLRVLDVRARRARGVGGTRCGAGRAHGAVLLRVHRGLEQQQGARDLQRHGAAINLGTSGYNVQMFFNGSATAGLTINLTGTVAAGDVYVLAQSSANAAILAQADQTNGSGWFNGDDAVVLRKGTTVIDVDRPDRLRPRDGVGHRPHEHGRQHAPPQVADRGGRPQRRRRLRPRRRVGRLRDRHVRRARRAPRPTEPAPTVVTTTPVDGEADVGLNSPRPVTFSEPVDVRAPGTRSSARRAARRPPSVSGGADAFTLQPTTPFVGGDSCTFTVLAAGVTDQDTDDPYDAMARERHDHVHDERHRSVHPARSRRSPRSRAAASAAPRRAR